MRGIQVHSGQLLMRSMLQVKEYFSFSTYIIWFQGIVWDRAGVPHGDIQTDGVAAAETAVFKAFQAAASRIQNSRFRVFD